MNSEIEIMDVDIRQTDDETPREFGIITFGNLTDTGTRITNNPSFAAKRKGKSVVGEIIKVKVQPYSFENEAGETINTEYRKVVKLGTETLAQALSAYRAPNGEHFEMADLAVEPVEEQDLDS